MKPESPRIKRLSPETVSMIAAGEVIENVASVVRELVENSIDAEAKNLKVNLKDGGKRLIQVEDDGVGMTLEEIHLAVERFTTSKIEKVDDLKRIRSLGFRGEALYAISTVSRVKIRSSIDGKEGWEVSFEGGRVLGERPIAFPRGTTLYVADLFFNFPARRKFLSSSYSEGREATEVLISYALAHPGISFQLLIEGREIFSYPPAPDWIKRIEDIYGDEFLQNMMKIERIKDHLNIRGFISRPDKLKERSRIQWIFVNGRKVDSRKIKGALYRAFEQNLKYPDFIIFLDVDPSQLDFNIHPQKKEVKFSPGLKIFDNLYRAVRDAMDRESIALSDYAEPFRIIRASESFKLKEGGRQLDFGELPLKETVLESETDRWVPETLWQIHNKYIIAQVKSGIIIVDQHAAHERIIYEELESKKPRIQMLLFPLVITLTPPLFKVLEEVLPMMEKIGFKIRILSGRTVVVEGVPQVIKQLQKEDFEEILEGIEEEKRLPERYKGLLKTIACKAAIKAGDPLDQREMNALLDQLFACKTPFFCPHGRPTVIRMTLEELDRKFERS